MRNVLGLIALFVIGLLVMPQGLALNANNFGIAVEVDGTEVPTANIFVDLTDATGNVIGEDVMYEDAAGVRYNVPSVSVEEGKEVEVKVVLETGSEAVKDIEVEAEINGYEYSDHESLSDSTPLFDMAANTRKTVKLNLELPVDLEKTVYWLYVRVSQHNSKELVSVVKLNVEPTRHGIAIDDVAFSPSNTIKAGRSLLTKVLLANYGDKDEEDVKVTATIPQLGLSATEYIDSVNTDEHNVDYDRVPEMFLPIPANAAAGDYQVVVTAEYDRFETVSKTYTVKVVADERFQPAGQETLVLAVGPEMQNIAAGKVGRYAIALTNAGQASKAYLLSATSGNGLTTTLSENLVVLGAGQNKVVYADVAVSADATPGAQTVPVAISANKELLETVNLGVTVSAAQAGDSANLRNGLEIALIVLVVVLIIIGVVIGFSRLRKDEDEGEEKTYY